MKPWLLALLSLAFPLLITAQKELDRITPEDHQVINAYEDTLGLLGFVFVNDSLESNRFAAVHSFIPTLVKALKVKNSFYYPFERLRTVSIMYPPDSTFRVFTWQLYVDNDSYKYYGAIQMRDENLKLFPLIDRSQKHTSLSREQITPEQWYGMLCYNLVPFRHEGKNKYLLFGMDYNAFNSRRKVIDVLSFGPDGKPVFGGEVFFSETDPERFNNQKRIVLDYSAEATIRCNYDPELEMVIFDHIVKQMAPSGAIGLPDGSYEALKYQNGRWEHITKVFHQVSDEAPRPKPVLDGNEKIDLFGRKS